MVKGVEKTIDCELILSKELKQRGLKTGKFIIKNDSFGGRNNKLSLYIIFEKNFDSSLTAKVIDSENVEAGRKKIDVSGKYGDAKYFDFVFDKRTNIGIKSKIIVE